MIKTREDVIAVLRTIVLLVSEIDSYVSNNEDAYKDLEDDIDSILNLMPWESDMIWWEDLIPTINDL